MIWSLFPLLDAAFAYLGPARAPPRLYGAAAAILDVAAKSLFRVLLRNAHSAALVREALRAAAADEKSGMLSSLVRCGAAAGLFENPENTRCRLLLLCCFNVSVFLSLAPL